MKISPSKFDVALAALGIGIVCLHALLLAVYLGLRHVRPATPKASKSDRPLWVAMVVASGSFWILASLQLYGVIWFVPASRFACVGLKYLLQYSLGWVLWMSAVLYRMIRMYMTFMFVRVRPLHAAIVVLLLLCPFLVLSAAAFGANRMGVSGAQTGGLCMQGDLWNGMLTALCGLYFAMFLFFFVRLLAVLGRLKGMKKYMLIAGLSFVFVVLDAVWSFRHFYEPLFRRLLVVVVLVLASLQTWTVFVYILVRPGDKAAAGSELHDQQKPLVFVEDAHPLPPKPDLFVIQKRIQRKRARDKAKDRLQQALDSFRACLGHRLAVQEEPEMDDEIDDRVPHYAVPDDFVFYSDAAVEGRGGRTHDFMAFRDVLAGPDKERVDTNQGIHAVGNMYAETRPVDVDASLKLLGAPIDLMEAEVMKGEAVEGEGTGAPADQ